MLEHLWSPKSVAVIGVSDEPGTPGYAVLDNLIQGGFQGELVPVGENLEELFGRRVWPDMRSYGERVELAIVATPAADAKAAVREAAKMGAKAAVVLSDGFREAGTEGAELEEDLKKYCRSRGMRLLGPNCHGVLNTALRMNATVAPQLVIEGGLSVVSQSGALCSAILDRAAGRGIGIAKLVTLGNKADISETDVLEALAGDDASQVVVGYLENLESGDGFVKVAEAVAGKKPVIVLKAGSTAAGARAASAHMGAPVGADIAFGAAFKRAGVVRAESFGALFDYSVAFLTQPLPTGRRVAVVTNAGGAGIMAADAIERAGLEMAHLTAPAERFLQGLVPGGHSFSNPVDLFANATPDRYGQAVTALLEEPEVDAVVVALTPEASAQPDETATALVAAAQGRSKPVFAAFMGGTGVAEAREALLSGGIADYPSPERAVLACAAMVQYAEWRRRPPRVVTRFPVNRRRVERIIRRNRRMGRTTLGEVDTKEILEAYGFNVPHGHVTRSPVDAVELAKHVGFPVALKVVSPDIVQKTDAGGVRLNLNDPDEVMDAFELMMLRVKRRRPEARIEGVYVEEMARRGRDVIIGMRRDAQFGPMLMFGLGGIFVEVMEDVTFHLAPITEDEALQMLRSTRSYSRLTSASGSAPLDLAAVASGLQRVSQLATDFPEVQELDINPFVVGEVGSEPSVVDARMSLRPVETTP